MQSRVPLLVMGCVLSALVTMGCTSYTEDIGGGFLIRTRVYQGMAHEYKEFDLYYRGILGIRRLIHKDIRNAEVSPDAKRVLFFARRHRPEPLEMDYVLYVFGRTNKKLTEAAAGDFEFTLENWDPKGERLIFRKSYEGIMLFDVITGESREITDEGVYFLGWSPSGRKIAYATGNSVYEENALGYVDIEESNMVQVRQKQGEWWRKEDFVWVTLEGEEKIIVKEAGR